MKNRGTRRLGLLASLVLAWAGLVIVVQPTSASAAEPWVDSTFGTDGMVKRAIAGKLSGHVVGQAKAPNGDLVMAIEPAHTFYGCCSARVGRWSLARVTASGDPAPGFGDGGVVQPALDALPSSAEAVRPFDVAVDSSGRILMLGTRGQGSTETPVVMRLTAAGAIDETYGTSGVATFPKPDACSTPMIIDAILTHDQGKVTIAGECYGPGPTSVVLARFTAAGALDSTFGTSGSGVRTISLPDEVGCCGADLHRLSDGRLFIRTGHGPGAVVRTSATGAPDPTFGDGGVVVLSDAADWYGGAAMLVAPDGSFLVDGKNDSSDWVAKYSANGVRDETYGSGAGRGTFPLPEECTNPSLVDLAGTVSNPIALTTCEEHSVLSALTADGSPDSTYGIETSSVRPSAAVGQYDKAWGSMLLTDGDGLLVTGATLDFPVRVERRQASGALDTGYGTAGGTDLDITGRLFKLDKGSTAVDAQGRVLTAVVADDRVLGDEHAILVSRFLPGGGLDTSFGQGGTATVEAGGQSPGRGEEVRRPQVLANSDGSVSVVARWKNENDEDLTYEYGFLTARLTSNGSPDTATVPGGVTVAKIPGMTESRDSDGGIAPTTGGVLVPLETADNHPAVAKLQPSGALDTSFAVNGLRVLPDPASFGLVDLHPAPNGGALLTWHEVGGLFDTDFVVARVTSAGSVDNSYGSDGRFRRSGLEPIPIATSLPTGELVYGWGEGRAAKLWRVTAGGTTDSAFGTSGTASLLGPSGTEARVYDLMATASGIEVGFTAVATSDQAMLGRLTNAGIPASDFGTSGVARAFTFPSGEGTGADGLWINPLSGGATAMTTVSYGALEGAPAQFRLTKLKPGGGGTPTTPKLTGPAGTVVTTSAAYSWTGLSSPYTVETSTAPASGAFGSWQAGSPTSQSSASLPLTAGTSTCVRVRSGGQVTPTSCVTSPVMSTSMTSVKTWKKLTASGYYRGTARKATSRGASLSSTVTAGGLDLVASRCGTCGSVNVFWNGVKIKSVSLKGTAKKRLVVPIVTWPDVRSGTVMVKVSTASKPVIIEGLATRRSDAP